MRIDNFQVRATATAANIAASATLTPFTATYGLPSGQQNISVTGANLTNPIAATAPTGFEVSLDQSQWVASTSLPATGGIFWARLKATAPVGTYNSAVFNLSSGTTTATIATTASNNAVTPATLTISGVNANAKQYDATTAATLTGAPAYGGLVNGENFAVMGTPVATFVSKNVGTGIAVTVTGYTAPTTNYNVTQPNGLTAEITGKPLTITANNVIKPFGTALTMVVGSTAFATSALADSETVGSVTIDYGSGAAATDSVGTYVGSVLPSAATGGSFNPANYSISYAAGDLAVSANPVITTSGAPAAMDTIYGTASATPGSVTVSGANLTGDIAATAPAGYEISISAGTGYGPGVTLAQSGGGVASTTIYVRLAASTAVGTYPGNVSLASSGATPQNVAVTPSTVSAKALTISGVNGVSKVYDRTTAASLIGTAVLNGVVGTDDVSIGGTPVATFASRNVGTAVGISVSGYTLAGTMAGNYTLMPPTGLSADISAKPLTVPDAAVAAKVYDGTSAATITGTLTGVMAGDTVTFVPAGTFAQVSPGTGIAVTSTSSLAGADVANYSFAPLTGLTGTITAKPLTITASSVIKTIGTTLTSGTGSTAFTSVGLVSPDTIGSVTITYGTGAAASDPLGSFLAQAVPSAATDGTFTATNYAIAYVGGDITVVPPLIAGWDFQTTVTGGTAAATAPGSPLAYVANFGSGTIYLDGSFGASAWTSGSSNPQVTAFGGTTVNVAAGFATATTSPACLALANSSANGQKLVFKFSMTNRINLMVSYAVQGTSTGFTSHAWEISTDGTSWVPAETVSSIPTGFATKTLGTITGLNQASTAYLRLTVNGATATSGNNRIDNIQLRATAGPTINVTGTAAPFTTTYGTASATQTFSVSGASLTGDITASAPVGFEVSSDDSVYGSTASFVQSGGNASGTLSVRLKATAPAGGSYNTQTIALTSSGVPTVNITTSGSGNGVVAKGLVMAGLAGVNKMYDGTTAAMLTGTPLLVGVIGSDDVSMAGTPAASFADANVGTSLSLTVTGYTLAGAAASNYTLTQPAGLTADITGAPLTITASSVSKAFGTTLSGGAGSTAFTAAGLVGTDTVGSVTISYGTGAAPADGPGTFVGSVLASAATGGSFDARNYMIAYQPGDIVVTSVPTVALSGAPAGISFVYGNAAAGTVTSFSVSASQLSGDLTVIAPGGFVVSTSPGSGFVTSLTLTPSGGAVPSTSIYVRLAATDTVGIYTGDVALTGGGAVAQAVTVPPSTVIAKALTISGLTGGSKVYDRTETGSVSGTAAPVGVVGSDDVSLSGTPSVSFASVSVANGIALTVTGYSLSGTAAFNYTLVQPTGLTGNITAKALTIGGAAVASRNYDGTTSATITGTLSGVIAPDDVTLVGTGTFASAGPGNGIAVTSTSTLSGADAGNYSLTQPTGLTGTIMASSNANLSGLVISAGTLSPLFSPGVLAYSATIPGNLAAISVTPLAADAGASVRVNGDLVASGAPMSVPLVLGLNTVAVLVTAADNSASKTYTLSLNVGGDGGTFDFATGAVTVNPVDGSGQPSVVTVQINRTGALGGDVDVDVVSGAGSGLPKGQVALVKGTDYTFVDPTPIHFHDGDTSRTVSVTLKGAVRLGAFTLNLAGATAPGVVGSGNQVTITVNAKDVTAPTLTLNAVPATAATHTLTVSGTVKDGGAVATGVSKVDLVVTNITGTHAAQTLTLAPVTPATIPPSFTFTGDASLENGVNTLTITAYDGSGNKLTKTAKTTFNDGTISALAGTYSGLLLPQGTVSNDSLGYLTITATVGTAVSGKLTVGGAIVSFGGALDSEGDVHFKAAANAATLDIVDKADYEAYLGSLSIHLAAGEATGTLKDNPGGVTLSVAQALPQASADDHLLDPSKLAQKYTVRFPSIAQVGFTPTEYPQGDGYALVTVSPTGAVAATGMLADGTAYSGAGRLNLVNGTIQSVALHTNLYRRAGAFATVLSFAFGAEASAVSVSDVTASEGIWIRPNVPRARYYKAGWPSGLTVEAEGGRWSAPPAGQSVVPDLGGTSPNARLSVGDGSTRDVNISTANVTANTSLDPAVKLSISATLGTFKGMVTYGSTPVAFQGVIIRKGPNIGGFGYLLTPAPSSYTGTGESLSLVLEKQP